MAEAIPLEGEGFNPDGNQQMISTEIVSSGLVNVKCRQLIFESKMRNTCEPGSLRSLDR